MKKNLIVGGLLLLLVIACALSYWSVFEERRQRQAETRKVALEAACQVIVEAALAQSCGVR